MLLEARDLHAGYGKVQILHGIEFSAAASDIVTVLGPNGAGKSTLMRALAGHIDRRGEIEFQGTRIERLPPHQIAARGLGYVPQERNVFGEMTVADNLRIGALTSGENGRRRIEDVLATFPILAERRGQRADTLSGGQRQILAIASALVAAPELLLLDEPSAGLAPQVVDQIVDWVSRLASEGTGIVWVVEQNPEPILAVSSQTYLLEGGVMTRKVASRELLDPGRLEAFLLEDRGAAGSMP